MSAESDYLRRILRELKDQNEILRGLQTTVDSIQADVYDIAEQVAPPRVAPAGDRPRQRPVPSEGW